MIQQCNNLLAALLVDGELETRTTRQQEIRDIRPATAEFDLLLEIGHRRQLKIQKCTDKPNIARIRP